MVDQALTSIVESQAELAPGNLCGSHFAPQCNRYVCESRLQPTGSRWPNCAISGAILEAAGKSPEHMRHGDQAADTSGPHVALRIEHFRDRAQMVQARM